MNAPVRVVMLAPRHRPWGNRVAREAFALAAAGYQVKVLARTDAEHVQRGVRFVPGLQSESRFWALPQVWSTVRWALRENADVYHLHNPAMLPVGFALKALGKRVIYDTHEDFSRRLLLRRWIPRALRRPAGFAVSRAERLLSRVADATLVTQAQQVQDFGGRARLLRNAPLIDDEVCERVDEWLCANAEKDRPHSRMLYVGSLTRARGGVNWLDALRQVNEQGVACRLWLIGPDDDGVVGDLRKHPAWEYVDYLGLLPQVEAFGYMVRADVGLAVLPDSGDHRDALPSKLFEYIYWGLPFVASDFPAWRSFVGEKAGSWVPPDDSEKLASALLYFFNNPEARKRAIQYGHAFGKNFNWESEQRILIDLYENIFNVYGGCNKFLGKF